ncbi:peptide ABC transporter ATP-binding protein [Escherichia coli]|nr:peptide ABC transporter ATP-binding protein [Escherichia coli]
MSDTLLTLRDVHINFPARKNWLGKTTEHVHAINGIDLQIRRGETLGIVGESGCGKSTLAQLLMGMLQPSHGQYIRSGSQRIMQMVFQDPLSSLNPRLPVWRIITEPLWIAKRSSEQQRRALAEELAVQVGIRPEYLDRLPHAFSGGQRQRIAIARALSSQPDVIVLDEPTSALDISVQAQILNLLSTLAQLLMGMLQPSHGQYIRSGSQRIMQMVFQDPLSSLNPRLPVWRIITEPLWIAKRSSEQQRRALAEELAVQVGIRPEYLDRLPHAFSGGQRQRIAIARALSSQPDVIVLDEPTSALDISVQAQILNLLVTLQDNHGLTYVLISHNVSVIRHMSDRVAVMYLGQIVELGEAQQVLTAPAHPYTRLLLDSLPAIDKPLEEEWALRKTDLPGNRTLPQGCFFYERCPLATSGCEVRQSLTTRADGREIRCWRAL